ncbi:unnamed protein product [Nippostrongylus brasiliensis]|uniref:DUF4749 domain-containing protein n=1 Tax=Nippostrongylus brasiliensis TaxID=27835 RepID=A0A0N4YJQ7_NIPBR|nr:unnamed protein product [Nippostrongylus brasiliensis]
MSRECKYIEMSANHIVSKDLLAFDTQRYESLRCGGYATLKNTQPTQDAGEGGRWYKPKQKMFIYLFKSKPSEEAVTPPPKPVVFPEEVLMTPRDLSHSEHFKTLQKTMASSEEVKEKEVSNPKQRRLFTEKTMPSAEHT